MRTATCLLAAVALALPAACGGGGDDGQTTVEPALLITPTALAFPGVCRGQADAQSVTVTNVSAATTVHLAGAELQELGAEFTLEFTPATLAPGDSATVTVAFTPAAPATPPADRAGFLAILHDAPDGGGRTMVPILGDEGQPATLNANPNPVDFEAVEPGGTKTLDVLLKNFGCDTPVLSSVHLALTEGVAAFAIDSLALPVDASLPLALAPSEELGLAMRFTPPACGAFATSLVVEGTWAGSPATWSFDVTGRTGPCPQLVVTPGQVEFAGALPGKAASVVLVLSNKGDRDVTIPAGGIAWMEGSDASLSVPDLPGGDLVLAPGASRELTVTWTPGPGAPTSPAALGTLRIASDDPYHPSVLVPVNGGVDAPVLVVIPDTVDLGFAAQNTPVERVVTLQNGGAGTLHVASVQVVDPSRTGYGNEWEVQHGADRGTTLPAFQVPGHGNETLKVVFTLKGPRGNVTATLRITSDDPARPVLDVPLLAHGIEDSWCLPQLVPAVLQFGAVPLGESFEKVLDVVNTGTGSCTFQAASVADCTASQDGIADCPEPFPPPVTGAFTLVSVPSTAQNGIAPGATASLTVRFTPTTAGADPAAPLDAWGRLAVRVHDAATDKTWELPAPGNPAVLSPNLHAQVPAP